MEQEVRQRIHYAELCTVYPPVSQVVFGAVATWGPLRLGERPGSGQLKSVVTVNGRDYPTVVPLHVYNMKIWITFFDLFSLTVMSVLLRSHQKHLGWMVAYAWCPLILKEFANSGHLDSIAVFFSLLAAAAAQWWLFQTERIRTGAIVVGLLLRFGDWGQVVSGNFSPPRLR